MFTKTVVGTLLKLFALGIFIWTVFNMPFAFMDLIHDKEKFLWMIIFISFPTTVVYIVWKMGKSIMKDVRTALDDEDAYSVDEFENVALVMFAIYLLVNSVTNIPNMIVSLLSDTKLEDLYYTYAWIIANLLELMIAISILYQRNMWLRLFKR